MGLDVKATCDLGPDHTGPFFSLYARIRQVGAGRTARVDRLRIIGVFCADCLNSGSVRVSLAAFGVSTDDLKALAGARGSGAGTARE